MSILIKGMKMPTGEDEGMLIGVYDGKAHIIGTKETREAVELPDHGNLIDIEVFRNLTGMRTDCSECKHCGLFGCEGVISTDYI